jgi:hypothetical protein
MAEIRDSWREVAHKAEALGLKLKLHLEQEEDGSDSTARPGATKAAIDDLGNRLKEAFESFGSAAKDPAVRSDVTDIGLLLKDALLATFSSVGADVGDVVKDVTEAVKKAGSRSTGGASPAAPASDTVTADPEPDDPEPTDPQTGR